ARPTSTSTRSRTQRARFAARSRRPPSSTPLHRRRGPESCSGARAAVPLSEPDPAGARERRAIPPSAHALDPDARSGVGRVHEATAADVDANVALAREEDQVTGPKALAGDAVPSSELRDG